MNEIPIEQIKPAPDPIRKTWDEDKMNELAQSIRENGVIVPIKVRANGEGFEVVYGHRRLEASKRAGLKGIPAIVENVGDKDTLIQALIENVVREDMTGYDTALALKALKDQTGWNYKQVAKCFGKSQGTVSDYFAFLKPEILEVVKVRPAELDSQHIREARSGSENDADAAKVLLKTAREELSKRDTRQVAEAYRAADTPELKAMVLDTPGNIGDKDNILMRARMKLAGQNVRAYHSDEKRKEAEARERSVADFIDEIKLFERVIATGREDHKYGKFSPEGARFVARRLEKLVNNIEELREVLNNE